MYPVTVQRRMTAAVHRVSTSPIVPHPGFEEEAAFRPSGSLSYRPRGRTTPAGEMYARRNVVGNPIPTDPGFESARVSAVQSGSISYRPRGRTRPDAADNAQRQMQGTLARVLYPEEVTTPRYKRPQSKDFMRINAHKVKDLERKSRQHQRQVEEEQAAQAVKGVHFADKYQHVQPKVTAYMKTCEVEGVVGSKCNPSPRQPRAERPSSATLYRGHSQTRDPSPGEAPDAPRLRGTQQRPSSAIMTPRTKKNFMAANIRTASQHKVSRPPSVEHLVSLKGRKEKELAEYQRGVVPQYLKERQGEWKKEEERRKANAPDPSIPPGHALMPAAERRKTLDMLKDSHTALTDELQAVPITSDTLKQRTKRAALETKLAEVEDAIKIFSRTKVYIKLDD